MYYIYIIIFALTLIFAFVNIKMRENYFFILWLTVAISLSFIIRMNVGDPNSDIEKYVAIFGGENFTWTPNYIREFIFWGYARVINFITPNRLFLLMGMDLTLFLLLYKSFNLIRIKYYKSLDAKSIRFIYFGALIFFPYYLGMHLQYRQIFACTIFIIALGCTEKNIFLSALILLISLLTHNIVFILTPIFFMLRRDVISKYLGIILVCLMPLALIFMENSDNEYIRRHDIRYSAKLATTFLLYFAAQFLSIVYIENIVLSRNGKLIIIKILSSSLMLYLASYFFLESALSIERIGLFIFAIIYPFLAYYIEVTFINKKFFRFLFINISIIPIITFYNN
jgi:hypothetical protein